MDELFTLVYFLIALNMMIVLFIGYSTLKENDRPYALSQEADNIFVRSQKN